MYVHSFNAHCYMLSLKAKQIVIACKETYPIAKVYFFWWTIVIDDLPTTYNFKEKNPKAIDI